VRKKVAADFFLVQQAGELLRLLDSPIWLAVLLAVSKWEEESVAVDQDYFHSGCTGNAERHLENQPPIFTDSHG
jgi:hypothetical protein